MATTGGAACPRILIIGAGCAGLGAAYRLRELGHLPFLVLESNAFPGGLSSSFVDARGFTWDLGGHVQFSHYAYFDAVMRHALGADWLEHLRQSSIWIRDRFIPYPFQNNLRHLPADDLQRCLDGLIDARTCSGPAPSNFREWIEQSFGAGIAGLFLLPYNWKVWAHPLESMDYRWSRERIAPSDLARVLDNVRLNRDDAAWGPNANFRFPLRGGTGAIWRAVAARIPARHLAFNTPVVSIDTARRCVRTTDGVVRPYDVLISTLPLDVLATMAGDAKLISHSAGLRHCSTHVVGIGLAGRPPEHLASRNWMYFPEDNCPFYRITVFSNYSPNNVPDPLRHWSLMAEVSESRFKPYPVASPGRDVIAGLRRTGLIGASDEIVSVWHRRLEHGYPVPTVGRDSCLEALQARLEPLGIYSRGRFGAWKYEVANQDHTFMQGVEVVNRLLLGEAEITLPSPEKVNAGAGC